jgi:hypothetical protein
VESRLYPTEKLARWSIASCALALACWPFVSKRKRKKKKEKKDFDIEKRPCSLAQGPAVTAQGKNRGLGSDLGETEFGDHCRVISQRRREAFKNKYSCDSYPGLRFLDDVGDLKALSATMKLSENSGRGEYVF